MIQLANEEQIDELKKIWKTCFGDNDKFIDLFFSKKFKPQNTLIYIVDKKIVASLQMQQYYIKVYDEVVPIYYLVGLCTLPNFREQGYMKLLIQSSFEIMKKRNIPLAVLVPAEEWLFNYYNRFDFEKTFEKNTIPIELKEIIIKHPKRDDAFCAFDQLYQQNDFTVLKNKNDFSVIIEDLINENYPLKYNLDAMSAIVDLEKAIQLYAKANKHITLQVVIKSESRKSKFFIKDGSYSIIENLNKEYPLIQTSKRLFTKLFFGYKLDHENGEYQSLFRKRNPVINLMLE